MYQTDLQREIREAIEGSRMTFRFDGEQQQKYSWSDGDLSDKQAMGLIAVGLIIILIITIL